MKPASRTRLIFVTGTDTGVGKTVLTSLLIAHLQRTGACVAALKPLCSGSRSDAEILFKLQDGQLTLNEINPWFFPEPVAPLVGARSHHQRISLDQVHKHIRKAISTLHHSITPRLQGPVAPILLIEGAGGLLVPLGERFTTLELIRKLRCEVIVVASNRLGTINHTLLTVQALKPLCLPLRVVLMEAQKLDPSAATNGQVLREWLGKTLLFPLPFLGSNCGAYGQIIACADRLKPILRRILA